jgi:hypothetical protein
MDGALMASGFANRPPRIRSPKPQKVSSTRQGGPAVRTESHILDVGLVGQWLAARFARRR